MRLDIKELKQIVELMRRSDLTGLEIEEEGLSLRLKRENGPGVMSTESFRAIAAPIPAGAPSLPTDNGGTVEAKKEEGNVAYIKSPMVGTFYKSPAPDSPAFVSTGSNVVPETVVCIIEAMKVMNEILAETKGTIIDVLVENGQAVEFGQPLFKVKLA